MITRSHNHTRPPMSESQRYARFLIAAGPTSNGNPCGCPLWVNNTLIAGMLRGAESRQTGHSPEVHGHDRLQQFRRPDKDSRNLRDGQKQRIRWVFSRLASMKKCTLLRPVLQGQSDRSQNPASHWLSALRARQYRREDRPHLTRQAPEPTVRRRRAPSVRV